MSRIAALRDTHLTRDEIAGTALRQFDERVSEPTIRSLASELRVAPTAIYHHYASRADLFQGVVELVWNEAMQTTLTLVPDLFVADPVDVLVAAGLGTRRTWLAHHRVARYMAATPAANRFVLETVGVMANLFERLGLEGEEAAATFHSYASFMIGAVLFAADRKTANEQLSSEAGSEWSPGFDTPDKPEPGQWSSDQTRAAIDTVMSLSQTEPERDEELFVRGLRRMILGFRIAPVR
jgi:AcrR family transcriptional regulator